MRTSDAPLFRTAAVALVVSTSLAATSLVRAIRIPPVNAVAMPSDSSLRRAIAPAPVPAIDIDAVGANDLFQPDRTAPPSRYRMPGDRVADAGNHTEPDRPVVLGTVVATDGRNYATCTLSGGAPKILHVGDQIGGYTVKSIDQNKVVFKSPAGAPIEIAPSHSGQ